MRRIANSARRGLVLAATAALGLGSMVAQAPTAAAATNYQPVATIFGDPTTPAPNPTKFAEWPGSGGTTKTDVYEGLYASRTPNTQVEMRMLDCNGPGAHSAWTYASDQVLTTPGRYVSTAISCNDSGVTNFQVRVVVGSGNCLGLDAGTYGLGNGVRGTVNGYNYTERGTGGEYTTFVKDLAEGSYRSITYGANGNLVGGYLTAARECAPAVSAPSVSAPAENQLTFTNSRERSNGGAKQLNAAFGGATGSLRIQVKLPNADKGSATLWTNRYHRCGAANYDIGDPGSTKTCSLAGVKVNPAPATYSCTAPQGALVRYRYVTYFGYGRISDAGSQTTNCSS